ncbi:MAG: flagellar biosynthesis protein FlhB [Candidatus Latescibacteria bacterium 4484_7]|nr:MAG: flagellar biosynthesis protein FlhB [Candidatus Latescibacteria bacterium 4484_7]
MVAEFQEAAEKSQEPTPKRRKDAREKGQVVRSQELNSFVILLAGVLILSSMHNFMLDRIERFFALSFNTSTSFLEPSSIQNFASSVFKRFVPILAPIFIGVVAGGLLVNIGQVGFNVSSENLKMKFDRINPISGFKKIFSWRSLFEMLKSIIKLGVMSFVIYTAVKPSVNSIISLPVSNVSYLVPELVRIGSIIALRALIVMAVLAVMDYGFQYWQHEKSLRMTIRELKDELKETEGDPLVKERLRSIQRDITRKRMLEAVKKADVVITNPTYLAVAVQYTKEFQAPKVVAKGKKHLAEKIRKIAVQHGIPIVENKPLAWALYKSCKVGGFIPVELYKAVAEILAYVYSLKNKRFE